MSKISELSDGGSLVSSDYLIAVRSGGNVKVRMDQINVDQVDLGDNEFIRLGNSQDLTMVHTSTQSIINQAGIGDLLIQKAGSTKLTINASGIDVTGSVTADGLDLGATTDAVTVSTTASEYQLQLGAAQSTTGDIGRNISFDVSGATTAAINTIDGGTGNTNALAFYTAISGNLLQRLLLEGNGDVNFYEDTGTTPKFVWDASAESLTITGNSNAWTIDNTTIYGNRAGGSIYVGNSSATGEFGITSGGAVAMQFDVSGNVGIGTSAPQQVLQISQGASAGTTALRIENTETGIDPAQTANAIEFYTNDASAGGTGVTGKISHVAVNAGTTYALAFSTYNGTTLSESMRIDSVGNVTIKSDLVNGGGVLNLENTDTAVNGHDWGSVNFISNDSSTSASGIRASIVGTSTSFNGDGNLVFSTAPSNGVNTEAMRIDASGNVGIGATGTAGVLLLNRSSDGGAAGALSISGDDFVMNTGYATGDIVFKNAATEAMRIDGGNLLVGKTASDNTTAGHRFTASGFVSHVIANDYPLLLNRLSSDGALLTLRKDSVTVGSIGTISSNLLIGTGDTGFRFFDGATKGIFPDTASGAGSDDAIDLGKANARFDDIYATNGVIQTSDRNEKQDIEALSDAEQRVAVAAKGLLRKFRWKDAVEAKGDDARIHFGIIAQDLQAAFEAEGLDAGRYAMFMSNTWTDEETGEERTRLGVRYHELLAFIIAAI